MKVAVICEFSGIVRDAFIRNGHDAISCDLEPTEKPGPHIQGDCREYDWSEYDLIIAHPECTFLTVTANRWLYHPDDKHLPTFKRRPHPNYPNRKKDQKEAVEFVKWLWKLPVKKIAIENPKGVLSSQFMPPSQYIQPFWFGDPSQKLTGLWLRGLSLLIPTNIVKPEIIKRKNYSCPKWMNETGRNRKYIDHKWHYGTDKKTRSRTFYGIAQAMADQWGV